MDRKEILSYTYRIQEYYENGLRNDGDNLLAKLIDEVKATARAEALRDAAERADKAVQEYISGKWIAENMQYTIRAAIFANKQEPPR